MLYLALVNLVISFAVTFAQSESCSTTTTQIVVPTTTYTFLSIEVITIQATTPDDLGTFTDISTIRSTKTLATITSTITDCTRTDVTQTRFPTYTSYTTAGYVPGAKRLQARQDEPCSVTVTETTTYGATETWVPANETSIYTRYTDFVQHTVSTTVHTGTTWTIATAFSTTCTACGPVTSMDQPTTTTTQDIRCAPTAMVSAAGGWNGSAGYGLLYMSNVPYGGAVYETTSFDASSCCQLCVQEDGCAASAWDIRTSKCRLQFSADWQTGDLNCEEGALVFYDSGPNHPMDPGSGWYMGTVCGRVSYAAAKPDDGT